MEDMINEKRKQNYTDFSSAKAKLMSIVRLSLIFTATNKPSGINHPKQDVNGGGEVCYLERTSLRKQTERKIGCAAQSARPRADKRRDVEGKVGPAEQCTAARRGSAQEQESLTRQQRERTQDERVQRVKRWSDGIGGGGGGEGEE